MYAISYYMQSGATVHRAPTAKAAMELVSMIALSGGTLEKIVVTRTGEQVSVSELRDHAMSEVDPTPPPQANPRAKRWVWWHS